MGSAVGAWWYTTQRRPRVTGTLVPARQHGTVIFDNTPVASDTDAII